ncbi:TMA7-domain-containing protein [Serendipita vermifera]|nr:TMA7-domain-containing protein [Serendipita vermifera]
MRALCFDHRRQVGRVVAPEPRLEFRLNNMSGRQGGKLKPLKAAKKEKREDDEDDAALKAKLKKEAAELKAAQARASQGGPMGGSGIKKSGKK